MRIMVVDDNVVIRKMLRMSVVRSGDEFRECSSGEEAMASLESFSPDLVLMDVQMGGMDGIEATRKIKTLHPNVRVIVVTNFIDAQTQRAAMQAGADDFVAKDRMLDVSKAIPPRRGDA